MRAHDPALRDASLVAARVNEELRRKGWTQHRLVQESKQSATFVSEVCHGKIRRGRSGNTVADDRYKELARALDLDVYTFCRLVAREQGVPDQAEHAGENEQEVPAVNIGVRNGSLVITIGKGEVMQSELVVILGSAKITISIQSA